ncbi:hypothetical protein BMG05_07470 [Mycobacterium malmoense]|nr:hypothetical protein BMG05_07470 [Mycobacterium malmoense]
MDRRSLRSRGRDDTSRPYLKLAHLLEPSSGISVVLGAGFGQLVLHQLGVHGQCGERVEFLVCLGEVTPGAVVVKAKVMGGFHASGMSLRCASAKTTVSRGIGARRANTSSR